MKELRCSTCGAPLSPVSGEGQCRCEYCGSINLLEQEEKRHTEYSENHKDRVTRERTFFKEESERFEEKFSEGEEERPASEERFASEERMVVSIAERQLKEQDEESGKKRWRARASKGEAGFGTSVLRMYMVIMIVAVLLVSFALNSASVMADEGNDLRSVPQSAKKLEGKEWMDVVQYFRDCGFEEIEACEQHDLSFDFFHKEGKVDEISISGCTNFDEDATFYKDAEVIIYYHSFK